MATISTKAPTEDKEGFISPTGTVTLNSTIQSVNKNEPIFGVGENKLQGYVAVKMYDQITASAVGGDPEETSQGSEFELYNGTAYASGKPYVMNEATIAKNVNYASDSGA